MKKLSVISTFNILALVLLLCASLVYHCLLSVKAMGRFSSTLTADYPTKINSFLPGFPCPLLAKEFLSNHKPH